MRFRSLVQELREAAFDVDAVVGDLLEQGCGSPRKRTKVCVRSFSTSRKDVAMDENLLGEMRHLAGIKPLFEGRDIEALIRLKLKEVLAAAKTGFREEDPADLADKLEDLLRQANLVKPHLLDQDQYNAAAAVWELLSSGTGEPRCAEKLAMQALALLPDKKKAEAVEPIEERTALPKDAAKTLDSISRWLKGVTPTANAFAKRMGAVASSGAVDKAVQADIVTVANSLQGITSLVAQLDAATKRILAGGK